MVSIHPFPSAIGVASGVGVKIGGSKGILVEH